MTDDIKPGVSVFTKLAYGFGSVAYGVKNSGFDYFFLIFYSQVMGVDAGLVGTALLIALIFDAFSDPLIGYLSDNTHSRWGRRHPFMYFASIPVAVSYFFYGTRLQASRVMNCSVISSCWRYLCGP